MSRYFFDLFNDTNTFDQEGVELADGDAALARARELALYMAAESVRQHGHLVLTHRIVIRDADGTETGIVRFGDVVRIEAS